MDEEETEPVMLVATCRTPECPMEGTSVTAPFFPNTTEPIYRAQCTQCGQPVTDLVPAA